MKKRKITRDQAVRFSIFIILGILAIFFVLPYVWMILNSFKSTKEILMSPKNIFPEEFTLAGYEKY